MMAVSVGLGFTDAMASADMTYVHLGRALVSHTLHLTGKEKIPTLAYRMLADHTSRVLFVTKGHEGSQIEKTIIRLESGNLPYSKRGASALDVVHASQPRRHRDHTP